MNSMDAGEEVNGEEKLKGVQCIKMEIQEQSVIRIKIMTQVIND